MNIDGIEFEYFDEGHAIVWSHIDGDLEWFIQKLKNPLLENGRPIWMAFVQEIGDNGRVKTLNTRDMNHDGTVEQEGPLYKLDPHNHTELIKGMAKLIAKHQWPED